MLAKDFEIGKVYSNEKHAKSLHRTSWWWVARYSADGVVCVKATVSYYTPFVYRDVITYLSTDYEEVPFDELTSEEQIQLTIFMAGQGVNLAMTQKRQTPNKGCTCEIMTLMASGCQCGWIKVERQKVKP